MEQLEHKVRESARYCRDPEIKRKVDLFLRALQADNVAQACKEFGKAPRYYYYWWNRYRDSGFNIDSLQKKSRRPKRTPRKTPHKIVERIRQYREHHLLSPDKIRHRLEVEHNLRVSKSTIYRVILRENLPLKKRQAQAIPTLDEGKIPTGLRVIAKKAAPRIIDSRYLVERQLGHGGGGFVYLAQDKRMKGQLVALKLSEITKKADPALASSLKNEFTALTSLNHPYLAKVFDFGVTEQEIYFTSEWIEGVDILTATRDANLNTVFGLILQTLRALDFLHGRGILHLDLKPENILVTDPGKTGDLTVKLIDFGNAYWKKKGHTLHGEFLGTPPYAAPEMILERSPSPASDIYSLGIILHQIFAGKFPFTSKDPFQMMNEQIYGEPQRMTELHPALPENFSDLLWQMVAKDAKDRLQNPAAVVRALNECLGESFNLYGENAPTRILAESDYGFRQEIRLSLTKDFSEGRPQVVVLSGEAGMGKARLMRQVKDALQLGGIHPYPVEEREKLEEYLKSGAVSPREPLFIQNIPFTKEELVVLLDTLENLRIPVLLSTTLPHAVELNPTRWIELGALSPEEIVGFLETEITDFPLLTHGQTVHQLCRGDFKLLEELLQAMRETGLIQWSDQGWRWVGTLEVDFADLLPAQGRRWEERKREVLQILDNSPIPMNAKTLAGILELEAAALAPKLSEWEGEGLLQSKRIRKFPHYFGKAIIPVQPAESPLPDWDWFRQELEKLYGAGKFAAGVELANVIRAPKQEYPEEVSLACARLYVAAGFSQQALQALPSQPPSNPSRLGLFHEIRARASFEFGEFEKVQEALNKAETSYGKASDRLGLSRVFNLQASLFKRLSDLPGAENQYSKSIVAAREAGDAYAQGTAQMNLAILHYEQGKFELAQKGYEAAFKLEKIAGQPMLSTKLRDNWVNLLFYSGRSAEAEAACYDLLKVSIQFQVVQQQASALTYMALLAGQKNQTDLQLNYLNQALGLIHPQQNTFLYFQTLIDRGYLQLHLRKFTAAQLDAEAALKIGGKSGNTTSQAMAFLLLGKILRDRPKADEEKASELLNNAHQIIWKNRIRQLLWEVEFDRGLLAKKRLETARAKNYFLSSKQHLESFLQEMPEEFRQNYLRDRKLERVEEELARLPSPPRGEGKGMKK